MPGPVVPQPSPSRLTPFLGHPIVAAISDGETGLVLKTAAALAVATGGTVLAAYVDESRFTEEEFADGSVRHAELSPDEADDDWRQTERRLTTHVGAVLDGEQVAWEFRYLAGRPDRALTQLARAVDAAVIVVGSRAPGHDTGLRDFFDDSLALRLSRHQHRPVLSVPLTVVDWKAPMPWE